MAQPEKVIIYTPRGWTRGFHTSTKRWRVMVVHRRAGKTVASINHLIRDAMMTNGSRFAYIAPTYRQAKDIVWDMLKHYAGKVAGVNFNESELRADFGNGARLRLYGADNPDALRGIGLWGVIFDEYSQQPSNIFTEIIRPALADHKGYAIWIGCVKNDTKIITKKGISEIVDFADDTKEKELKDLDLEIYGIGGFNKTESFWNNGKVKTKRITTNKGFILEASLVHPILNGKKEWVKMKDLSVGDEVSIDYGMEKWGDGKILDNHIIKKTRFANARKKDEFLPNKLDNDFAYLLGLWMAEGSVEKNIHRLTITCGDDVSKDIGKYGFFKVRKDQWRLNSYQFEKLFDIVGMPLTTAPNKFIPNSVWNFTREQVRNFIGGYFDGDGHTNYNKKGLVFTSSSRKLLSDLQLLCTNFGAIGRITEHLTPATEKVKKECVAYRLSFCGKDYEKVVEFIKPRIKRKVEKIERLKKVLKRYSSYKQKRGKYFIDKIIKIENDEAETYDFVIPKTHSFWSNGFISHNTPKGKNDFYRLYQHAISDNDWLGILKTVDDTGIIDQAELDDARKVMTEDEYNQEFYCSFEASIKGAYFAKELAQAREEGRINKVKYDNAIPVFTFWDLGVSDATAIGFYQRVGNEIRMIDYFEANNEGLDYYKKLLDDKGYVYGGHFAPHDIAVRELTTGKSRQDIAKTIGINFEVVPKLPLSDGIHAGRMMFPRLWVDEEKCGLWLDYIAQYRQEWDDKRGMFKDKPLHDFTSHAGDVYRYCAIGESMMSNEAGEVITTSNINNYPTNPEIVDGRMAEFIPPQPEDWRYL